MKKKIDWPMSARVECRPRLLSAICRFNTHLCLCFHGNVIGLNGPISRGVRVFFGKHKWIAIIRLGINGQLSKRGRKGLTTLFNDLVYLLLTDNPLRDVYPLAYFSQPL